MFFSFFFKENIYWRCRCRYIRKQAIQSLKNNRDSMNIKKSTLVIHDWMGHTVVYGTQLYGTQRGTKGATDSPPDLYECHWLEDDDSCILEDSILEKLLEELELELLMTVDELLLLVELLNETGERQKSATCITHVNICIVSIYIHGYVQLYICIVSIYIHGYVQLYT